MTLVYKTEICLKEEKIAGLQWESNPHLHNSGVMDAYLVYKCHTFFFTETYATHYLVSTYNNIHVCLYNMPGTYLYSLITLHRVQRVVRAAKVGRHKLLRERLLHLWAVSNLPTEGDFFFFDRCGLQKLLLI